MTKVFNFKSLLFKILFLYILISIISIIAIFLLQGYLFNKLTYTEAKRNLLNKPQKINTLSELVKNGTIKESRFNKNLKTIELYNHINIERIKVKDYFKGLEVNNKKCEYMLLGAPVYDKKRISCSVINIFKKRIEKHCSLLLYNFTKKLINFL
jgi:hypothetical protein